MLKILGGLILTVFYALLISLGISICETGFGTVMFIFFFGIVLIPLYVLFAIPWGWILCFCFCPPALILCVIGLGWVCLLC